MAPWLILAAHDSPQRRIRTWAATFPRGARHVLLPQRRRNLAPANVSPANLVRSTPNVTRDGLEVLRCAVPLVPEKETHPPRTVPDTPPPKAHRPPSLTPFTAATHPNTQRSPQLRPSRPLCRPLPHSPRTAPRTPPPKAQPTTDAAARRPGYHCRCRCRQSRRCLRNHPRCRHSSPRCLRRRPGRRGSGGIRHQRAVRSARACRLRTQRRE